MCSYSKNQIIFGAPGTGKSFLLDTEMKSLLGDEQKGNFERVTFHPDYTYANFVGTYKPVMKDNGSNANVDKEVASVISVLTDVNKTSQDKYDELISDFKTKKLTTRLPILLGLVHDTNPITETIDGDSTSNNNNVEFNHGRAIRPYVMFKDPHASTQDISYEYVPGPFMRVLAKAMKNKEQTYVLLIEEINRANVSAVFGDIFQLLDRDSKGDSQYCISTSNDMRQYLARELVVKESDVATIKIPSNMYIWATMNSADQGVFPMDTAFKRRWDFHYIDIDAGEDKIESLCVNINNKDIVWNNLRKAINNFLAKNGVNEDKLMGPFFIPVNNLIDSKDKNTIDNAKFISAFKNKVLMYLFEDAARQKRKALFADGIEFYSYGKICKAFDKAGLDIFNKEIVSEIEIKSDKGQA